MNLTIKQVSSKNKNTRSVKKILKDAFPKEERMPFFLMLLLSKSSNTDFLSFYDEETLCGVVYLATYDKITFLIYLAIDELVRTKGYGTQILKLIEERYPGNKIILYIDRCETNALDKEQRIRRKSFYSRNGYKETGYLVKSTKEYQEILIKNGQFNKDEFLGFLKMYSNGTLKPNIMEKV